MKTPQNENSELISEVVTQSNTKKRSLAQVSKKKYYDLDDYQPDISMRLGLISSADLEKFKNYKMKFRRPIKKLKFVWPS